MRQFALSPSSTFDSYFRVTAGIMAVPASSDQKLEIKIMDSSIRLLTLAHRSFVPI